MVSIHCLQRIFSHKFGNNSQKNVSADLYSPLKLTRPFFPDFLKRVFVSSTIVDLVVLSEKIDMFIFFILFLPGCGATHL